MWKKQDDAVSAQPDFTSKETPDLASLGEALVQPLINDQFKNLNNDQFKKGTIAVGPEKVLTEDHDPPLPRPSMKTYTEAMNEFTKNATGFIEQLPLLAKARVAYEEAMRAIAEMRKVLDADEENLRTLMTQLEKGVSVRGVEPAPHKKNPELAKVEKMRATDEGGGRTIRWP
jgi:hypothetical protein